jgi:SAM-dependent methyltransferase
VIWILVLLFALVFLGVLSSLFALWMTGVPVVRTPATFHSEIAKVLNPKPGEIILDAGCGDGRLLRFLCAKEGVLGKGTEINGPMYFWASLRTLFSRERKKVRIHWGDFFREDWEELSFVYCHLMPGTMPRVARKCEEEMRPGSFLISYLFEVPGWTPTQTVFLGSRSDPLYVYKIAAPAGSGQPSSAGSKT